MKKINQTNFTKDHGNCLQACIASILELDLEDVPDFCNLYDDEGWYIKLNEWLLKFNLSTIMINPNRNSQAYNLYMRGYHLGCVRSPKGCLHSVVVKDGEIVHDPNPEYGETNFDKEFEDVILFTAVIENGINE